jgi:hypothetical protein
MATLVLRGLGRYLGLGVKRDVQLVAECGTIRLVLRQRWIESGFGLGLG